METVSAGKEIYYYFSIDYDLNHLGTEVVEVRCIKKVYKCDTSNTIQYHKANMRMYSLKEAENRIVELLATESLIGFSAEITLGQFKMFMDESCDLFSVDKAKLNLRKK